MKLKELLNTKSENLDEAMKDYFAKTEVVRLEYTRNPLEAFNYLVQLNGVQVDYGFLTHNLGKWLTKFNKVVIEIKGASSTIEFPIIKNLNVGVVDFSKVKLPEGGVRIFTLLQESEVREIVLPKFPKRVGALQRVLEKVKVDILDLTKPFENTNFIGAATELFYECELDFLDLSNIDFSKTHELTRMFENVKAKEIVLPKNIGKDVSDVFADKMFYRCEVDELKNLEYFPFDKLVSADRMFHKLKGITELAIDSKLNNLVSAPFMFSSLKGVSIKLPNVEKLPRLDDWFTEVEDCKIYIPKLNVINVLSMDNVNDTNEIFCNRELANKLI